MLLLTVCGNIGPGKHRPLETPGMCVCLGLAFNRMCLVKRQEQFIASVFGIIYNYQFINNDRFLDSRHHSFVLFGFSFVKLLTE